MLAVTLQKFLPKNFFVTTNVEGSVIKSVRSMYEQPIARFTIGYRFAIFIFEDFA
jgi:hypothetical protein